MDEPIRPVDGLRPRPQFFPKRKATPDAASYTDPVIVLSPTVLERYNARVLDPSTSIRVVGQEKLRSTVYIAHQLLVTDGVRDEFARTALEQVASDNGL